jgi:hypothetical protein
MKIVFELDEKQMNILVNQVVDDVYEKINKKAPPVKPKKIFYTATEVAEMSKRTAETVRIHIKMGLLEAEKCGKRWMISEENYIKYISNNNN